MGDTLDYPTRKAFPRKKENLLSVENGDKMFNIAREALRMVAKYNSAYKKVYENYPNKFCHGFGIFQYDLQFFKTNPNFFLNRDWYVFEKCLEIFVDELKKALIRAYGPHKDKLTDIENVFVAIAYNRGSVDFSRGFKQGYKDSSGIYYGEHIWEYLKLSESVPE